MQETIVILGDHMTSVNTDTTNLKSSPYRVSGEQLVVGLDSCEFNHTEFHYHVVNKLLSFLLSDNTVLKVSFNIDIKECGDTSNTHRSTILCLDCCKISKIQPLECFMCIFCRL